MSKIQAWRKVRGRWAAANSALVELETAYNDFVWAYPDQPQVGGYAMLPDTLHRLYGAMREVGWDTKDVMDDIVAEEG